MQYYARVAIGVLLGLFGAVGLALLAEATWPVALAGALFAAVGFLATFFVWSADRPPSPHEPQGYEQVLFDGRNLAHVAALALVLAGGATGWGAAFGGAADPAPADPAQAALDAQHAALVDLALAFADAHSAYADGNGAPLAPALAEEARGAAVVVRALETGAALQGERDDLVTAAERLAEAFDALAACDGSDAATCLDARVAQGNAVAALEAYGAA